MNYSGVKNSPVTNILRTGFLFLGFVIVLVLLRSIFTHPIEHGDAIQKYYWAARILDTGDWGKLLHNHHTLRWTVMLPQTALTWLLGKRFEVFYILPMVMFSLYLALVFFGLKGVFDSSQRFLLTAILFMEPTGFINSAQLLNPPFGIFFAIAGCMVLVKEDSRLFPRTIVSALLFFLAYGAHVTYLGFAGGAVLWLLFCQGKVSRVVVFCATLVVLLFIETWSFNYISDGQLNFGRWQALYSGHHVERALNGTQHLTLSSLFARWFDLSIPSLLICLGFLVSGGFFIQQKNRDHPHPELIKCLFLVGLSFAVSITFAVVSIDPIKPAMSLRPMYLHPFLPIAAIMSIYCYSKIARHFLDKKWLKPVTLTIMCLVLVLPVNFLVASDRFNGFVWQANREYKAYSERFRNGQLALTGKRKTPYSLIAQFEHPLKVIRTEDYISVSVPHSGMYCVERLNKAPLYLNFDSCTVNQ